MRDAPMPAATSVLIADQKIVCLSQQPSVVPFQVINAIYQLVCGLQVPLQEHVSLSYVTARDMWYRGTSPLLFYYGCDLKAGVGKTGDKFTNLESRPFLANEGQ